MLASLERGPMQQHQTNYPFGSSRHHILCGTDSGHARMACLGPGSPPPPHTSRHSDTGFSASCRSSQLAAHRRAANTMQVNELIVPWTQWQSVKWVFVSTGAEDCERPECGKQNRKREICEISVFFFLRCMKRCEDKQDPQVQTSCCGLLLISAGNGVLTMKDKIWSFITAHTKGGFIVRHTHEKVHGQCTLFKKSFFFIRATFTFITFTWLRFPFRLFAL